MELDITVPMTEPTLHQSAVEYAGFWFKSECACAEALSSDDHAVRLQALQRAAGYFRIARNMPKAYDVGRGRQRLEPVLDLLDAWRLQPVSTITLPQVVRSLRQEIGAAYGGRDLLSAATKFLWLLHRDTVIIFDSQVRDALGSPYGDYDGFLDRWRAGYAGLSDAIRAACTSLPATTVSRFCGRAVSQDAVAAIATKEWFLQRVYDICLWRRGAP
jgi:hypothetical protein